MLESPRTSRSVLVLCICCTVIYTLAIPLIKSTRCLQYGAYIEGNLRICVASPTKFYTVMEKKEQKGSIRAVGSKILPSPIPVALKTRSTHSHFTQYVQYKSNIGPFRARHSLPEAIGKEKESIRRTHASRSQETPTQPYKEQEQKQARTTHIDLVPGHRRTADGRWGPVVDGDMIRFRVSRRRALDDNPDVSIGVPSPEVQVCRHSIQPCIPRSTRARLPSYSELCTDRQTTLFVFSVETRRQQNDWETDSA